MEAELQMNEVISGMYDVTKLSADFRHDARNLILRFCPPGEINKKRQA